MGEPIGRGRPRSEAARTAVLHAVDDLLVEQGYAAMTLKGLAERAGVSRQTIYRWWSTKAEILFEASWIDAEQELAVASDGPPAEQIARFIDALGTFLSTSAAGAGYRALVGEAQHDDQVASMLATTDVLGESARRVIARSIPAGELAVSIDEASALLVGPVFFWVLAGRDATALDSGRLAARFLAAAAR